MSVVDDVLTKHAHRWAHRLNLPAGASTKRRITKATTLKTANISNLQHVRGPIWIATVTSQTDSHSTYDVSVSTHTLSGHCNCPDWQKRMMGNIEQSVNDPIYLCKHIIAVLMEVLTCPPL